ncbi:VanZ family protein [Tautonia sociabilis]|uniref:VanZ family protein n=1 Tax=Tautonia sociabilis TaxID=2080755 RepID=A0A432MIS7_9BACT|nr:VanZ family protein [Tautonia sociabilis]RUL87274.1 VanZ family protein [Tautonia sociabilis]
MRTPAIIGLGAAYLVTLVDLTLVIFPQPEPAPNLVPMRTISACWEAGGWSGVMNLGGNLALLAPMGMIVGLIRPGRGGPAMALVAGAVMSLAIELAQFAGGHRTADVDDVLLNTIGAILGALAVSSARWATSAPGGSRRVSASPSR